MQQTLGTIKPEDLDEASIFLYRLWAYLLLEIDPISFVMKEPEYVVVASEWVVYSNRGAVDLSQLSFLAQDTGRPVVCAAPGLSKGTAGLDVLSGVYQGAPEFVPVMNALIRSARELPRASLGRDPLVGRWKTKMTGEYELWRGKQGRLICTDPSGSLSGFTWALAQDDIYFFRSRSFKREGKRLSRGHFRLAEQIHSQGRSHLNLDLVDDSKEHSALLALIPAGAGYKVFPRQLPKSVGALPGLGI